MFLVSDVEMLHDQFTFQVVALEEVKQQTAAMQQRVIQIGGYDDDDDVGETVSNLISEL